MIDRYSLTLNADKLAQHFHVDVPDFYKARYNAAPSQLLPVITSQSPGGLSLFYWGKPPEFARSKALSEKIINLKVEGLHDRPRMRATFFRNRCLVPADGLYVWKKVGSKTQIPHRYVLEGEKPFSMAGTWEEYENENGEMVHTFTILTMPNVEHGSIDQDFRFPVILLDETERKWLDNKAEMDTLEALLVPSRLSDFRNYTVSPKISSTSADFPSLILPVAPSDQNGNLTLFD